MEPWERERKEHDDAVESKKERSRRRKKKREKAKREREAKAEKRRRERRHPTRSHREMTGPAVCPSCGDGDRLFTIEAITGRARGTARLETGVLHFEHEGATEIDYDSSTTIGAGCDCGWRGMSSELVLG